MKKIKVSIGNNRVQRKTVIKSEGEELDLKKQELKRKKKFFRDWNSITRGIPGDASAQAEVLWRAMQKEMKLLREEVSNKSDKGHSHPDLLLRVARSMTRY